MKVLIACHGTRGDVQPFVALAHALRESGHHPILAAPTGSASLAEPYGIAFAPIEDEMTEAMSDPELREAIETNYRGLKGKRIAFRMIRRAKSDLRKVYDHVAAVPADDVDVVVHPVNSALQHLAEKLGVPSVAVGLQPGWVPTDSLPSPFIPFRIPKAFNRSSYLPNRLILRALVGAGAGWRSETLGLPDRPHRNDALRTPSGGPATVLQAFSKHLLPASASYPVGTHTTGFWYLPAAQSWTPPERLDAFLNAGDPPVYIGFGSVVSGDPARLGRLVAEATQRAGVRAVLVTGWGSIQTEDTDRLLVLDAAPHDWLFPRMAAIVHHGGAGTTAAALASGRPQVVCPFLTDQPYWARLMHARGVSAEPLPQRRLTAERLGTALCQVTDDQAMAARANDLGRQVRAENGVGTAIGLIERAVSAQ